MQTIQNRSLAAFGAVLATFATVAAASPAKAEAGATAVVSYAGIDLGSSAGTQIVDRRIRSAARKVCGPMEFRMRNQVLACRREAVASARASLPGTASPVMVAAR